MAADPADLEQRIQAATPRDTVRGLIFNGAFAALADLAGVPASRACDPAALGRRNDFFSYPVAEYLRLAWAATAELERQLGSPERVFQELGNRAAARWLASPLGRTLAAIAGRDPRRLLANTPSGYRNVVSYGTRTVEWPGGRQAHIVFRHDFLVPPFHCGVIATALEAMTDAQVQVTGREVGFLDSEYDVTWTPAA